MLYRLTNIICITILVSSCGGGDSNTQAADYRIGGAVTGVEGEGLVLQNNGSDDLTVNSDGGFTFNTALADNTSYNVSVLSQPTAPNQTCSVVNGNGTLNGHNINDVQIDCTIDPYPILFDEQAVYSNEIYVAEAGDDVMGDGTAGNPYASIGKAAESASPGTRILVGPGAYGVDGSDLLQGSDNAPISIVANGYVLFNGGLSFSNPRYLVLEGLSIVNSVGHALVLSDGGDYGNPHAAEYVIVKNSSISSTAVGGFDGIFVGGVNNLSIVNNEISADGPHSSAIELVGSQHGVISQNNIVNSGGSGNGIVAKAGSSDIVIYANLIESSNGLLGKGLELGGSTDPAFFRPPLVDIATDPNHENFSAARITALSNVFENVDMPVEFVGCIDTVVANNTINNPQSFIVRILQEQPSDTTYTFAETRNGHFLNNIVVYDSTHIPLVRVVNIGPSTQPGTFNFNNNLWLANNESTNYITSLPATIPAETDSLYQQDPRFVTNSYQVDSLSPTLGRGTANVNGKIGLDYKGAVYAKPPAIGAYEGL